ncbi:MAG: hypothetical protein ACM34E_00225 [Acidobacteriota bacterium]
MRLENVQENMVHVNLEKLGGLRVVECDGRIVRSDSAFALRDCVTSQSDARVIVLDLSEVNAIAEVNFRIANYLGAIRKERLKGPSKR